MSQTQTRISPPPVAVWSGGMSNNHLHQNPSITSNLYHSSHIGQPVAEVRTNAGEVEGGSDLDVLHMLTPETAERIIELIRSSSRTSLVRRRHKATSPDYNNLFQFNRKFFKLEDTIDPYYLSSWLTFILIVLLVAAIEVPVMVACVRISFTAPLMMVNEAAKVAFSAFEELNNGNSTVPANVRLLALLRSVQNLELKYRESRYVGDQAWVLQLIACSIHLGLTVCVVVLLFVFRNTKAVKTRGSQFLAQSFGSGLALQLIYTLVAAAFCMQFTQFPSEISLDSVDILLSEQTEVVNLAMYGSMAGLFLVCLFSGAVLQKQRLIYLVFCGPLRPRMKIRYLEPLPFNILIFLISTPPLFVWRYGTTWGPETMKIHAAGFWAPILIYTSWTVYYVHKTKYIHRDYTDFHSNMRTILYYTVVGLCIILYSTFGPGDSFIAVDLGWQAVGRSIVTVHALESAACLFFQTRPRNETELTEELFPQAFQPQAPNPHPRVYPTVSGISAGMPVDSIFNL